MEEIIPLCDSPVLFGHLRHGVGHVEVLLHALPLVIAIGQAQIGIAVAEPCTLGVAGNAVLPVGAHRFC